MANELTPNTPLGRIDPNSLIGLAEPVVTPSAVEALSDSVRKGFITAEDITARIQNKPVEAAQRKATIQIAEEQTNPDAVARRKHSAEAQEAQLTFGTNLQNFQTLAPAAGIAQPMTSDGRPDYQKMSELGAQLAVRKARQQVALDQITPAGPPLIRHLPDGSTEPVFINKFGQEIDKTVRDRFSRDAANPFSDLVPGTTEDTTPNDFAFPGTVRARKPEPSVESERPIESVPSELQVTPRAGASPIERDAEIQRFLPSQVQSKQSAKPVVDVPGGGISLGVKPQKGAAKMAQDISGELAESMETLSTITKARPLLRSDVIGPRGGSKLFSEILNPVAAFFGLRTNQYQSQDQLAQAVNKKVMEGAQKLKGNLSDKDIRFLQASYPKLSSTSATWDSFLNSWERIVRKNVDVLNGAAPRGSTTLTAEEENWLDAAEKTAVTGGMFGVPKPVVQGVSGEIKTLPSGRRMQWDGSKFVYVP